MCIFHKWGKWGEIKTERWKSVNTISGGMAGFGTAYSIKYGDPIYYKREYQERWCTKCGKYQKKYID